MPIMILARDVIHVVITWCKLTIYVEVVNNFEEVQVIFGTMFAKFLDSIIYTVTLDDSPVRR